MKQRIRFGFRVRLPFGIFPNAAVFVLNLTPASLTKLQEHVEQIQSLLILSGYPDIAARLFVETG